MRSWRTALASPRSRDFQWCLAAPWGQAFWFADASSTQTAFLSLLAPPPHPLLHRGRGWSRVAPGCGALRPHWGPCLGERQCAALHPDEDPGCSRAAKVGYLLPLTEEEEQTSCEGCQRHFWSGRLWGMLADWVEAPERLCCPVVPALAVWAQGCFHFQGWQLHLLCWNGAEIVEFLHLGCSTERELLRIAQIHIFLETTGRLHSSSSTTALWSTDVIWSPLVFPLSQWRFIPAARLS